ncbi:unnamed protein product [Caenorhabditis brenneri]
MVRVTTKDSQSLELHLELIGEKVTQTTTAEKSLAIMIALVLSYHYAIKQALDQDYFAIKLFSDCRFVEEVIKRPCDFMSGKHEIFRDLVSEISAMMKHIHVSLEHVDSSDPGNRVADRLAKKTNGT